MFKVIADNGTHRNMLTHSGNADFQTAYSADY